VNCEVNLSFGHLTRRDWGGSPFSRGELSWSQGATVSPKEERQTNRMPG
jgi:hypothetical protein